MNCTYCKQPIILVPSAAERARNCSQGLTAKVTAYKGVIECGSAYLGGNAHKTLREVLGSNTEEDGLGGYMPQLIEEAIEEAHTNLDD
jgi:hypothetical protein